MKTCPICKTEFEPKGKSKTVYCPECRKNKNLCAGFYQKQHRTPKFCKVCGKQLINTRFNYCPDCNTPEKKHIRAMIRQRQYQHEHLGECLVCGKTLYGYSQYCDACRWKKDTGTIQKLTLDITLFFMIVRGLTLKESAREQMMPYELLKDYMDSQKGTDKYEFYRTKYEKEREERERKAA